MKKGKTIEKIQVAAGKNTYFIDIKKSREGVKYLKLTEATRVDESNYKTHSVIIFSEDIRNVSIALNKALKHFPDAVAIIDTEDDLEETEEKEEKEENPA